MAALAACPGHVERPCLSTLSAQGLGPSIPLIREMVREDLDLSAILDTYSEARGYAGQARA
jgi:hypothetical protein